MNFLFKYLSRPVKQLEMISISFMTKILMKFLKARSWILGIFMFLFGALKLINPFNGWFHTQLIASGIGDFTFPFGVGAEIITGLILLVTLIYKDKILPRQFFTFI